ncbi:MAG: AAA family ATPase [Methanosarcinales archaeon]|nr:AAA family ATPase [Methanosarcinales archaeon]
MNGKLEFSRLKKGTIFCEDFDEFNKNNIINFSNDGIAVLYGPNGIGKTSLTKILQPESNTEFAAKFNDVEITNDDSFFHIITDQNHRNMIEGETHDFLLGENIAKEFELKEQIKIESKIIFETILNQKLKSKCSISKKTSELLKKITNSGLKNFAMDLANSQNKGKTIDITDFIHFVNSLTFENISEFDENKMNFIKKDFEKSESVISTILDIDRLRIKQDTNVIKIEEYDEAIKILNKFDYIEECIICDNKINSSELLTSKTHRRAEIFESLDEMTREILENIIKLIDIDNDPFKIKLTFLEAIETENKTFVDGLINEIEYYFIIFNKQINNLFISCLNDVNIEYNCREYNKLIENQPELSSEDIRFIEIIINENIEKNINLERDGDNKNLKLRLGGKELLNQDRDKLSLSTGEQNFISLAFELLKAKKSDKKVIVLDDPISSFDSIYKNKIVYCIIKFLEGRNQIILTHNTDLIKLMEHQKQNCFNLYLFNNVENEENGFIRVNQSETSILLYLNKLLDIFRIGIHNEIEDEKMFLISMIPFMRGYAQIINEATIKEKLTALMHGYNNDNVNIADIYNKLFDETIETDYIISAKKISELDIQNIRILKSNTKYKLLSKTLYHTLIYFYLRLNVEKQLVDKFNINTRKHSMLSQIIQKSFSKTSQDIDKRIFLYSRKTLLNEFNHFEGNMNIFQPAIDISDSALNKEKNDIIDFLDGL